VALAFVLLFLAAAVPGFGLISATRVPLNMFERLVLGTVVGLALMAVGGAVAAATSNNLARWLPSLLALGAWGFYRRAAAKTAWRQVSIALGGIVVLLPNLVSILHDQTLAFKASWSYYTDLPFQMALVAETGFRPASVYPWSPDTSINYTWLFHSMLGAWGQLASLRADELVLQYWPILFCVLLPLVVAVFSYRFFKNHLATALALLALPFIKLAETFASEQRGGFQYPISPTFEFGLLLTLTSVLVLILLSQQQRGAVGADASTRVFSLQLLTLAILVFAAVGSKGSSWFILLGVAATLALTQVWAKRTIRVFDVLALVLTVAVGLAANLLVVGTTAGTKLNLAHLFEGQSMAQSGKIALALVIVAVSLVAFARWNWFFETVADKVSNKVGDSPAVALAGGTTAGFVAMVILKHPNGSQSYFWFTALILWLVLAAWFVAKLYRQQGTLAFAPVVLAIAASQIVQHGFRAHKSVWLIVAILAIGFGLWRIIREKKSAQLLIALAIAAAIGFVPMSIGLPHWSFADDHKAHGHQSVVTPTQLEALHLVADHTAIDDLVLTNQHCPANESGDPRCFANPDASNPWFLTSAFTGRRVLFESFGYDWQVAATLSAGGLHTDNRKLSEGFLSHPTAKLASALEKRGVKMIYLNKTFAHANSYEPFATLVFDKAESQVWALR
jgi:hypothetical protein